MKEVKGSRRSRNKAASCSPACPRLPRLPCIDQKGRELSQTGTALVIMFMLTAIFLFPGCSEETVEVEPAPAGEEGQVAEPPEEATPEKAEPSTVSPPDETPAAEEPPADGLPCTIALPATVQEQGPLAPFLYERLSRRQYGPGALSLAEVGSLLWAAGGVGVDGVSGASRTAPSAGATYPLDIYLVAGEVEGLQPGVYRYDHLDHSLVLNAAGDRRKELTAAALGQDYLARAPAAIVLVAYYGRTTGRYGERGIRYVYMDVGYASGNIHLQVEALNLATVAVGAFDDATVKTILETEGAPLLLMPLGRRP